MSAVEYSPPSPIERPRRSPARILALVLGCLLALPALAIFLSGGFFAGVLASQRNDGFLDVNLEKIESPTTAITAEEIDLTTDPGTPRWVLDALETDVRLQITALDGEQPLFIGIAPEADLDQYLSGVRHDEIEDVDEDLDVEFQRRSGEDSVAPPGDQDFWAAMATGTGTQELVWEATSGEWAVALLNANGSPGIAADVNVGIRSDAFMPVALTLLGIGAILSAIAVALVVIGTKKSHIETPTVAWTEPIAGQQAKATAYPLSLDAHLDPQLSNWKWLVKWFLAIPHIIILALLWVALGLLTIVAGVAILLTGRYPRGIFDFNVGVLQWSWRVSYYAFSGGLGTDQYPPFSLSAEPNYPARLNVEYPDELSRSLVLVKWWLLAIPHYVILAFIAGAGFWWDSDAEWGASGGLVAVLTLIAGVILLFTGSYPKQLFALIVGMNRWVYRVAAYALLMTDEYPPFRLDQGGSEPDVFGTDPPDLPSDDAVDLTNTQQPQPVSVP